MDSFWDFFWLLVWSFLFVAYLMVLFQILVDLLRDRETSGIAKAVWVIGLVFLPMLTALAYLVARGGGMAERQVATAMKQQADVDAYVRTVAAGGASPAEEIGRAQALLDAGTINADEFAALKAKALS